MTLSRPDIDPDGLLEYSVVFSDLSLNHMSKRFVGVMQQLNEVLTTAYRADSVAIVPAAGRTAWKPSRVNWLPDDTSWCSQRLLLLPLVSDPARVGGPST